MTPSQHILRYIRLHFDASGLRRRGLHIERGIWRSKRITSPKGNPQSAIRNPQSEI